MTQLILGSDTPACLNLEGEREREVGLGRGYFAWPGGVTSLRPFRVQHHRDAHV